MRFHGYTSVCFLFVALLCSSAFLAAQPTLVEDINASPLGIQENNDYSDFFERSDNVYFFRTNAFPDVRLWRTDGTEEGTFIVESNLFSSPGRDLNGVFLYFKFTKSSTYELWKTDGSVGGGEMIKGGITTVPSDLFRFGNKLLFFLSSDNSKPEMWSTDGSSDGTIMIGEVPVTLDDPTVNHFLASGSRFFFSVFGFTGGVYGHDLWVSDGTLNGTTLLQHFSESQFNFTVLNSAAIITNKPNSGSTKLWKSDGTLAGTVEIKDIGFSSSPFFWEYKGKIILGNLDLWITDGTTEGTQMLLEQGVSAGVVLNDTFFGYSLDFDSQKLSLISTDGTPAGTVERVVLNESAPFPSQFGEITAIDGKLLLQTYRPDTGHELGVSDGTTLDILKDVNTGIASSYPRVFHSFGDKVFFFADNGSTATELWITDGTDTGTKLLKDTNPGTRDAFDSGVVFLNSIGSDLLLKVARPNSPYLEIWKSDGTPAGTNQMVEFGNNPTSYAGKSSDDLYLLSNRRLFKTNGISGTKDLVKDFTALISQSAVSETNYFTIGGKLMFQFSTGGTGLNFGREYWITDGTDAGTQLLKDINPGSNGSLSFVKKGIKMSETSVLFPAANPTEGRELWVTDGTEAGTVLVKDIRAGAGNSDPDHFVLLNGVVFFQANNGIDGSELWKTDGTPAGTVQVADLNTGAASSSPQYLTTLGNHIYFSAFTAAYGWSVWKTDGTETGTVMVKDLAASASDEFAPINLFSSSNKLYFSANDGEHGEEFWVSDGTTQGTELIDLIVGPGSSWPSLMTGINDLVYFKANDELWRYSPALKMAERVSEMLPLAVQLHEGEVYFVGRSALYGQELFKVPIDKFNQGLEFGSIENKVQGGNSFQLSASSKTATPISFSASSDKVSISGNTVSILKPGQVTITASQAGNTSFKTAEQVQTFCINPAKPTITESNENAPKPALVSSMDSGNNWSLLGNEVGSGTKLLIEKAGTYTLTVSVDNCVSEAASIDVPKIDQVITLPLESRPFETGSFTLDATTNSGLPLIFEADKDVLSITGNVATIVKSGTVTVTAKQAGDELFDPAELSKTICIIPAKPSISVSYELGLPKLSSSYTDGNLWYLDDNAISSTTSSFTVSSAGVYVAKVSVDGCISLMSNAITVEKISPTITFEPGDHTFESGTFALLASSSSGKEITFTSTSDKISLNGTIATIHAAGNITIKATTLADDLYNAAETEKTFCVLPAKPIVTVTDPSAGGQTIHSSAPIGNQWYFNGDLLSTGTQQELKVSNSGSYSVQVTVDDCSSPFSESIVLVVTGLESKDSISLFPSPTEKFVTINGVSSDAVLSCQIYNSNGALVGSQPFGRAECTIDISDLSPGVYTVMIQLNQGRVIKRFVKN